jgi:hypothetical protein
MVASAKFLFEKDVFVKCFFLCVFIEKSFLTYSNWFTRILFVCFCALCAVILRKKNENMTKNKSSTCGDKKKINTTSIARIKRCQNKTPIFFWCLFGSDFSTFFYFFYREEKLFPPVFQQNKFRQNKTPFFFCVFFWSKFLQKTAMYTFKIIIIQNLIIIILKYVKKLTLTN